MKKALLLCLGLGAMVSADAQFAADNASEPTYVVGQEYIQVGTTPGDQTGATNGKNGGFGFLPWQRGGYGSPTHCGNTLIKNVSATFNMGTQQFGMRSAPDGLEGADARRRLINELEVGQALGFSMMPGGGGAGTQNTHGDFGVELRSSSLSNPGRDLFGINGSNGQNYSLQDLGGSQFSNIPVTPGVRLDVEIRPTALGQFEVRLTPFGGSTSTYILTPISAGVKLRTFQFYCFETNGDFYTNFLKAWALPRAPEGYTIVSGDEQNGGLSNLLASDDQWVTLFNNSTDFTAAVEIFSTALSTSITRYTASVEISVLRPGLSHAILFYNYATNRFVEVGGGVAPISDVVHSITLTNGASAYVSGAKNVKIKINWMPINDEDPAQDGWLHLIDHVFWVLE